MNKVLVDREVLERIAEYVEKGQPGHIADKVHVMATLSAALEQPTQSPVAKVIWPSASGLPSIEWLVKSSEISAEMLLFSGPQPAQQAGVEPVANIEQIAQDRYKVVPSHDSMFYRFAVIAGNGKQQLYLGRETECQNMARKFAGAFLDGAFLSMQNAETRPDTRTAAIQSCIDRLIFGGQPAAAQILRHHFGVTND